MMFAEALCWQRQVQPSDGGTCTLRQMCWHVCAHFNSLCVAKNSFCRGAEHQTALNRDCVIHNHTCVKLEMFTSPGPLKIILMIVLCSCSSVSKSGWRSMLHFKCDEILFETSSFFLIQSCTPPLVSPCYFLSDRHLYQQLYCQLEDVSYHKFSRTKSINKPIFRSKCGFQKTSSAHQSPLFIYHWTGLYGKQAGTA